MDIFNSGQNRIQYEKHYETNEQILYDSTQCEVTRLVKTQKRES